MHHVVLPLHERLELVADTATVMLAAPLDRAGAETPDANAATPLIQTAADRLPGLRAQLGAGEDVLRHANEKVRYRGLVQRGDTVYLEAVAARGLGTQRRIVTVSVPLSVELVDSIAAKTDLPKGTADCHRSWPASLHHNAAGQRHR